MRVPRQPAYHVPPPLRAAAGRARRRWPRWVALGLAALLLACAAAGWLAMRRLNGQLATDVSTARELARHEAERPPDAPGDASNILLIGTDSHGRADSPPAGPARSDTVVLLHLAGDRRTASAVSVPRDLMVDVPRCARSDGQGRSAARRAPLNWAYQTGGAACAIRTLEGLTGIRVDHHLIVDFAGFRQLVDALGGVEMCLAEPVRDAPAGLDLPAGRQTLTGTQALAFVRARKDVGDGSDTGRIARQQEFLAALAAEVTDGGLLTNPSELYQLLQAASASVTTDTGIDTLVKLYDLLRELRGIPDHRFQFLTVPGKNDPRDAARLVLDQPAAGALFARLREDRPVAAPAPGASRDVSHAAGTCE